jgi:hypothetical protein
MVFICLGILLRPGCGWRRGSGNRFKLAEPPLTKA